MLTKAMLAAALLLIPSAGCSSSNGGGEKPIPPTPRADQFQGATSETSQEQWQSSPDER